jgi:hypothetical protein
MAALFANAVATVEVGPVDRRAERPMARAH